jgi:hypothetical protein
MRGWLAAGLLVAAILLGALAYFAVDRLVYEQGINLNLKLVAAIGIPLLFAAVLFIAFRRKKAG